MSRLRYNRKQAVDTLNVNCPRMASLIQAKGPFSLQLKKIPIYSHHWQVPLFISNYRVKQQQPSTAVLRPCSRTIRPWRPWQSIFRCKPCARSVFPITRRCRSLTLLSTVVPVVFQMPGKWHPWMIMLSSIVFAGYGVSARGLRRCF